MYSFVFSSRHLQHVNRVNYVLRAFYRRGKELLQSSGHTHAVDIGPAYSTVAGTQTSSF
jgi:hypothetical protein